MHDTPDALAETFTAVAGSACAVELESFGVAFGTHTVLADVTLALPESGVTVLMGPGGSGKSTLLKRLSLQPASSQMRQWGRIRCFGTGLEFADERPVLIHQRLHDLSKSLTNYLAGGLRQRIGANPTVLRAHVLDRLRASGLEELSEHPDSQLAELSTTGARLAALVRAELSGARIILVDEPTAGIDEADSNRILTLIQQLGRERCCLVTTHNQRHARRIATRVALLAGGRIQATDVAAAFFSNRSQNPILGQYLRTGGCSVPAPDAGPEHLENGVEPPPPLPAAARLRAPSMPATIQPAAAPDARQDTPEPAPADLLPTSSSIVATLSAPDASRGPRGFHWLVRGRLAGCAMPGIVAPLDHDLALLRRMGISVLINLTERDLPAEVLRTHGIASLSLRVEDRCAPPLMWTKLLLAKMATLLRDGETLAVHCMAGLGRTGTVLAAWLIHEGLTADEALRRIRLIDRGFVQSAEQEALLHALEENLLIRAK